MPNVVFAVPFAMENTLRFVRAALSLDGVRLGIVSQDPLERFPDDIRSRVVGFAQVADGMAASGVADGVRRLAGQLGKVDRLIGILEPLQVALAEVREQLRIRGMDAREATNFRDKATMKDVLRANGLPCARHQLCHSLTEALAFAHGTGFPLVAKPPAGAGARSTARVETEAELRSFLQSSVPSARNPVLLEEFVVGDEFSFDTVTLAGRHLLHSISCYQPTPLHVLENPWIQWTVMLPRRIDGPEFAAVREAGPRALDVLGMVTGVSHMEWFRRRDGSIALSEVAARPPGAQFTSLIGHAHGIDMYRAWAQLMVFETFDVPQRTHAAGCAYLRGQGQGKVVAVEGLDRLPEQVRAVVVESKLPSVGQPASGTYEGEGFLLVRHPDTLVVEEALRTIVSTVQVRLG
ncbi:MAG: hypothetical protein RL148_2743 [Planctomycetota bacterium]|jgi:formate-dependent phosphoribosylglycinamide formyltransferase (GAR transformylase)